MELINSSQQIPPEGMKLKALHHSILVKAEFFMKQNEFVLCAEGKFQP